MPTSSCLCGKNIITYDDPPIFKFRCHCLDERRLTGTPFCLNILYLSTSLRIVSGSRSQYPRKADSGNTITNHFCGTCGSLLYRNYDGYPGAIVIKAGCMDSITDSAVEKYIPDIEIFTRSRVSWIPAVEGAKQETGDFTGLGEL